MDSIVIKVNDFIVEYKQSKYPHNVEVYVNGDLVEDTQSTWFMSKLLEETLKLKKEE